MNFSNFTTGTDSAPGDRALLQKAMKDAIDGYEMTRPELHPDTEFAKAIAAGWRHFAHPDTVAQVSDMLPGVEASDFVEPGKVYAIDESRFDWGKMNWRGE